MILWFWFNGGGRDIMAPVIATLGAGKTLLHLKGLGLGGTVLDELELGWKGTGTEVGLKGPGNERGLKGPGGANKVGLNTPGIDIGLKGPGCGGGPVLLPNCIGGLRTKLLFSAGTGNVDADDGRSVLFCGVFTDCTGSWVVCKVTDCTGSWVVCEVTDCIGS